MFGQWLKYSAVNRHSQQSNHWWKVVKISSHGCSCDYWLESRWEYFSPLPPRLLYLPWYSCTILGFIFFFPCPISLRQLCLCLCSGSCLCMLMLSWYDLT